MEKPADREFVPQTALGKRLLELRNAYIRKGGKLLSPDELDREIQSRRAGNDLPPDATSGEHAEKEYT